MSPELAAALRRDVPHAFADPAAIECLDGWEPIVRRLAERIEPLAARDGIRVAQIKEKYGHLRCYLAGPTGELVLHLSGAAAVDPLVAMVMRALADAKVQSLETCEECGAVGRLHGVDGHAFTRCDPHAAAVTAVRAERRRRWREGP